MSNHCSNTDSLTEFESFSFRNDVELKPSAELTTAEDDDGRCQLGLPEVSKEMAGTYTCIAENEVGLAKCKARISVTGMLLTSLLNNSRIR